MNKAKPLENIAVMLSASIPKELMGSLQAQDIFSVIILFTKHILRRGGRLVFGGHPTVTPLVHQVCSSVKPEADAVRLHQLRRFKDDAPKEVWDTKVFQNICWFGSKDKKDLIDPDLAEMRDAMAEMADSAIFVGGKVRNYSGKKPGIRDEYERFLAKHPQGPVYLLGFLEGESKVIIEELEHKGEREPNGLTDKQLRIIHHGNNIDLIVPVVVSDIGKTIKK